MSTKSQRTWCIAQHGMIQKERMTMMLSLQVSLMKPHPQHGSYHVLAIKQNANVLTWMHPTSYMQFGYLQQGWAHVQSGPKFQHIQPLMTTC